MMCHIRMASLYHSRGTVTRRCARHDEHLGVGAREASQSPQHSGRLLLSAATPAAAAAEEADDEEEEGSWTLWSGGWSLPSFV